MPLSVYILTIVYIVNAETPTIMTILSCRVPDDDRLRYVGLRIRGPRSDTVCKQFVITAKPRLFTGPLLDKLRVSMKLLLSGVCLLYTSDAADE